MRVLALLILALAAATFFIAPDAEAVFRQDPGDGCLCPDDPFCDCGSGDGSGGNPGDVGGCQSCGTRWFTNDAGPQMYEVCEPATRVGIYSTDCYIDALGTCRLWGPSCTIREA